MKSENLLQDQVEVRNELSPHKGACRFPPVVVDEEADAFEQKHSLRRDFQDMTA